jgi:hypothetical protein
MRINPLERREARFRDTLPGLPAVIQIDTSVQGSLACLELLSSEAIWQRAPAAVKNKPPKRPNAATNISNRQPTQDITPSVLAEASLPPPREAGDMYGSDSDDSRNPQSGSKSSRRRRQGKTARSKEEQSSGPPVTDTSTLTNSQEYQEMSKLIQSQQSQLDAGLAASSDRLGLMEIHLQELHRLDLMETNIATSMGYHVTTNKTLFALQQQQNQIMQMIGELMVEAKGNQTPQSDNQNTWRYPPSTGLPLRHHRVKRASCYKELCPVSRWRRERATFLP